MKSVTIQCRIAVAVRFVVAVAAAAAAAASLTPVKLEVGLCIDMVRHSWGLLVVCVRTGVLGSKSIHVEFPQLLP